MVGGAPIYISADLHLGPSAQGWVVSSLLLGAAFGATSGGKIADKFGRKPVIRVAAAIFVVATLGSALSPETTVLLAASVVLGFAVGCVSAVVPVYIGERAPCKKGSHRETDGSLHGIPRAIWPSPPNFRSLGWKCRA